jgi:hypothetical protein
MDDQFLHISEHKMPLRKKLASTSYLYVILVIFEACSLPSPMENVSSILIHKNIDSKIYLADLAISINEIKLETNKHALLGFIKDVKYFNNKFYVNDGSQVLVFNNDGEFLLKLGGKGGGPGEYGIVYSMAIDSNRNLIYISSIRKIIVFTEDNKLVNEKKYPMLIPYINIVDQKLLIISDEIVSNFDKGYINNTTLYELSHDLLIKDSLTFRKVIIDENKSIGYNYKFYISKNELGNYLYKPVLTQQSIFPDTIYKINGIKLTPYKNIIFEKSQKLNSDGLISPLMVNIINSTSYIICEYMLDNERMLFIYNKAKSKGHNLKEGILDENDEPLIIRPLDLENDVFYYTKSSKYTGVANEEMNPIIGIVKLK